MNKPEHLADISAELRTLSKSSKSKSSKECDFQPTVYGKPINVYLADLADRIDAASPGNCAAMRHAIAIAVGDLQSNLEMTPDERQFMACYLKAAIDKPARNCDKFQGDYKMLYTVWFDWTGSPSGQNPDGTVKMSFPEYLLAPATTKGGEA